MEKLIFLGIAVWISYILSDGFQPPQPVAKPVTWKSEISKPNKPNYNMKAALIPKAW